MALENYRARLAKSLHEQQNKAKALRSLIHDTYAAAVTIADELIGRDYKLLVFSDDGNGKLAKRSDVELPEVRRFIRHVDAPYLQLNWLSIGFEPGSADGYFAIIYFNVMAVDEDGITVTFGQSKGLHLQLGAWSTENAKQSRAELTHTMTEGFEQAAEPERDPAVLKALAFQWFKTVDSTARQYEPGGGKSKPIGFGFPKKK